MPCTYYQTQGSTRNKAGNIRSLNELMNICEIYYDFQDLHGHLDMIDGVISHLLHEKWKTFAKSRLVKLNVCLVWIYHLTFD